MMDDVIPLAASLQHPEGPDVLENGDIVFVETWTGKIKAFTHDGRLIDYATTYGGPNACTLGADGCLYVTQNGGRWASWTSERLSPPGIQRVWPDGRVETLLTEVDGVPCVAPNDLCFGADGRLYFTDPVTWLGRPDPRPRHILAVGPGGKGEVIAELGDVFPNGIAADRMGSIVWGETRSRFIRRKRLGEPVETLTQLPEEHMADGIKFDASGRLWITTVLGGGLDVLEPESGRLDFVPCPHAPLNCVFLGERLIVTDRGLWGDPHDVARDGRLIALSVGISGQPLFRGAL